MCLTNCWVVMGESFSQLPCGQKLAAHLQVLLDFHVGGTQHTWNASERHQWCQLRHLNSHPLRTTIQFQWFPHRCSQIYPELTMSLHDIAGNKYLPIQTMSNHYYCYNTQIKVYKQYNIKQKIHCIRNPQQSTLSMKVTYHHKAPSGHSDSW